MVKDDKHKAYRDINSITNNVNSGKQNFTKPSSKFVDVPSSEKVNLYSAICSDCHSEVRVNFQPVTTEPFYCDLCFSNHRIHHFKDK